MNMPASMVLNGIGVLLWLWGGIRLSGRRTFLWKIHALSISDVVGTVFILAGSLVYAPGNWTHILLALGAVVFWGTAFSIVLARLSNETGPEDES